MIGTQRGQRLALLRTADAGDNFRAKLFRQHHAGCAHAAAGTEDQHPVALFNGVMGDQHAVRRTVGHRQRRRLGEGDRLGQCDKLGSIYQGVFRHAAVGHFAHQPHAGLQRVDQHAVTHLPTRHVVGDLVDNASKIETRHHRQRDLNARHAVDGKNVVIVKRGGFHPYDDVAWLQRRARFIGNDGQVVQAAVLVKHQRFHGLTHGYLLLF